MTKISFQSSIFCRFIKNIFIFVLISASLIIFNANSSENNNINFTTSEKNLYFEKSQKPIKNILITNNGKKTLFIQAKIKKITNDDFENPALIDTKEIIITPKNAAINPSESTTFRVVYLPSTTQKENQYKVFFTPFDKEFQKSYPEDIFSVNVVTDPILVKDSLIIKRDKENITFKNNGNRSVYILDAKSCDKKYCDKLLDIRIPSNSELKLNIEKNKNFECIQKTGIKYKKVVVKY